MKLFASDFDGTLFNRDKLLGISGRSFEAITRFQEQGNMFGICTGRAKDVKMFEVAFKGKVKCDFYILMTGAVILDREYNVLYEKCIDKTVAKKLYALYSSKGMMNIVAHDGQGKAYYYQPYNHRKFMGDDDYQIFGFSLISLNKEKAGRIAAEMNEEYGEYVSACQNGPIVDVVAAGCSKASGMKFIKELYKPDKTYGIGDSFNDIPLLEEADVRFTFNSAPTELMKRADALVSSVSEALGKTGVL